MRRFFAVLAAFALLSMSLWALPHVHAYGGHDHGDHQHGPASHAHHASGIDLDAHDEERATQLRDCDPAVHAVPVVFTGVEAQVAHVPLPLVVASFAPAPPRTAWRATLPHDTRAHGPPPVNDVPARAPPLVHPA